MGSFASETCVLGLWGGESSESSEKNIKLSRLDLHLYVELRFFFFFFITLGLELSDTKVYEP